MSESDGLDFMAYPSCRDGGLYEGGDEDAEDCVVVSEKSDDSSGVDGTEMTDSMSCFKDEKDARLLSGGPPDKFVVRTGILEIGDAFWEVGDSVLIFDSIAFA